MSGDLSALLLTHVPKTSPTQAKRPLDECACCGRAKEDHCEFEPVMVPGTCECYGNWDNYDAIPEVCDSYEDNDGVCRICEHDEECHKGVNNG